MSTDNVSSPIFFSLKPFFQGNAVLALSTVKNDLNASSEVIDKVAKNNDFKPFFEAGQKRSDQSLSSRIALAHAFQALEKESHPADDAKKITCLASLSHTNQWGAAVVAIKKNEISGVGIDIERKDRVPSEKIFYRITTEAERTTYAELPPLLLWSLKEAAFKAVSRFGKNGPSGLVISQFELIEWTESSGELGVVSFIGKMRLNAETADDASLKKKALPANLHGAVIEVCLIEHSELFVTVARSRL